MHFAWELHPVLCWFRFSRDYKALVREGRRRTTIKGLQNIPFSPRQCSALEPYHLHWSYWTPQNGPCQRTILWIRTQMGRVPIKWTRTLVSRGSCWWTCICYKLPHRSQAILHACEWGWEDCRMLWPSCAPYRWACGWKCKRGEIGRAHTTHARPRTATREWWADLYRRGGCHCEFWGGFYQWLYLQVVCRFEEVRRSTPRRIWPRIWEAGQLGQWDWQCEGVYWNAEMDWKDGYVM